MCSRRSQFYTLHPCFAVIWMIPRQQEAIRPFSLHAHRPSRHSPSCHPFFRHPSMGVTDTHRYRHQRWAILSPASSPTEDLSRGHPNQESTTSGRYPHICAISNGHIHAPAARGG
ncbi:hypothetical protein HanIR_Chr16g0837601 [Helianthus annuus]|nr:hypothetical protein HanIR_Chr16g0837601 [Helianthus annuus]